MKPIQHRAADLIGRGWSNVEVAAEVGQTSRTISRWRQRPAFQAAVRRARKAQLDEAPTARAALEAALAATTPRGHPDWQTRVKAATALLGHEPKGKGDEKVRETRIYLEALDDEVPDADEG